MKRLFFLFTALSLSACTQSQTHPEKATASKHDDTTVTLNSDYIKNHTTYFTIEDNTIKGEGKSALESIANTSQFVVYGEIHGSEQTSILNNAFIPMLADAGFKHFAIEVGPHSATKLTELSTPANKTVENLKAFYSKYTVSRGDDVAEPIPFFTSIMDAEFLKQARLKNMALWGLDQEFYFSAFFLMDELTKTAEGTANYNNIVQLQNKAQTVMYNHFVAEFIKKEIESAYALIKEEQAVKNYFDAFETSNQKAQAIINDMKISWDIYINWRNGSHADRVSYMRNNFMKHYNDALKTEKLPKVYTKIGSAHAKKTISRGAYDIGDLVESLAQKNGTKATSIGSWRAFEKDDKGNVVNNFERYKGFKRFSMFFPLAKENEFAIIDLRAIRDAMENNKIQLPNTGDYHSLRNMIYSYDYHIMLPVCDEPTPNRN